MICKVLFSELELALTDWSDVCAACSVCGGSGAWCSRWACYVRVPLHPGEDAEVPWLLLETEFSLGTASLVLRLHLI